MRRVVVLCVVLWTANLFAGVREGVAAAQLSGGIVVHLNCGDGQQTAELLAHDQILVHGLDADPAQVDAAHEYLLSKGISEKVSVSLFDGTHLPYADNLVNLIVADSAGDVSDAEILRVLVPLGRANIGGRMLTKPWPPELDSWGHYLHSPDNNAVALDTEVGLPRALQWVDGPKWARSHEEFSTISITVSSGGRIFYIVDKSPLAYISFEAEWRLVARDAFNGQLLWEKPIPNWNDHMRHFRSGPAHLPRRLVADGDRVYVTLGLDAPLTQLDAATGKTLREYKETKWCEEILSKDGRLYLMVGSSEMNRFGKGLQEREVGRIDKRYMMAVEAETGKELWRKNAKGSEFVLPLSMALSAGKFYYHSIKGLGCLDAETGKEQWLAPRQTLAGRYGFASSTLVATPQVVLLADQEIPKNAPAGKQVVATTDLTWGVDAWSMNTKEEKVYLERSGKYKVTAYSTKDGSALWSAACGQGYNSPADVFVIDDVVWLGPIMGGKKRSQDGRDLLSGEVVRTIDMSSPKVGMGHHRCYRDKATVNYLLGGHDGIEFFDVEKGWVRNNSWTRGPCQLGIMPCNGLIYAPTDPCACHLKMRMSGFKSYSSQRLDSIGKPFDETGRLLKGPAFDRLSQLASRPTTATDWPFYRKDMQRSGSTSARVSIDQKVRWETQLAGKLTQPVSAQGRVYVAASDRNTVYALDDKTGREVWRFVADGAIDSSPTLYQGMVLFGSDDGRVTCLDAATGDLAWRFLAAPEERLIAVYGILQSSWPVHGSVIVKNGEVCFTAGSSSYINGGIFYYRLDPISGKVLATGVVSDIDPVTERQVVEEEANNDSEGTTSDILSSDGKGVFLKHLEIADDGTYQHATRPHLISPTSLLDEEWFVRSYWTYAADFEAAGYGGWVTTANNHPAGRILVFTDDAVYGYGRIAVKGMKVGHNNNSYHLFSSIKEYEIPPAPNRKAATAKKKKVKPPVLKDKAFNWSETAPFTVRAMVATPDSLLVAGVPNLGVRPTPIDPNTEPEKYEEHKDDNPRLEFADPVAALEAFRGQRGAYLRMIDIKTGKKQGEIALSSTPVSDGMSVANGKLFISMKNGCVVCYGE